MKRRKGCILAFLFIFVAIGGVVLFRSGLFTSKPLVLRGHTQFISSLVFSPDGKLLASGSTDGAVMLWNTHTGSLVRRLAGPTKAPWHLAFSPDGSTIADGDLNSNIILWNVSSGALIKTLPGHIGEVTGIEFSPNGKLLATASHEKVATIWDIDKGKPIKQFWKHKNWVAPVAFSPDGNILATGDYECIQTWDVRTGKRISKTPNPLNHWFRYSSDGSRLVTGGIYSQIKVWDTSTWQVTLSLADRVDTMDLSKDGRLITGANLPEITVKVRDIKTGALIQRVEQSEGQTSWPGWILRLFPFIQPRQANAISRVCISPDGKTAAVASSDRLIRLWKLR